MSNVPERPDLVTELLHRVAQLERQVRDMQSEVRTRRLVVVDQHGHERIVGECRADLNGEPADLRVTTPDDHSENHTSVSLFTSFEDEAWNAGIYLHAAGNGVAMLQAQPNELMGLVDTTLDVGGQRVAAGLTDLRTGITPAQLLEWGIEP